MRCFPEREIYRAIYRDIYREIYIEIYREIYEESLLHATFLADSNPYTGYLSRMIFQMCHIDR